MHINLNQYKAIAQIAGAMEAQTVETYGNYLLTILCSPSLCGDAEDLYVEIHLGDEKATIYAADDVSSLVIDGLTKMAERGGLTVTVERFLPREQRLAEMIMDLVST